MSRNAHIHKDIPHDCPVFGVSLQEEFSQGNSNDDAGNVHVELHAGGRSIPQSRYSTCVVTDAITMRIHWRQGEGCQNQVFKVCTGLLPTFTYTWGQRN